MFRVCKKEVRTAFVLMDSNQPDPTPPGSHTYVGSTECAMFWAGSRSAGAEPRPRPTVMRKDVAFQTLSYLISIENF